MCLLHWVVFSSQDPAPPINEFFGIPLTIDSYETDFHDLSGECLILNFSLPNCLENKANDLWISMNLLTNLNPHVVRLTNYKKCYTFSQKYPEMKDVYGDYLDPGESFRISFSKRPFDYCHVCVESHVKKNRVLANCWTYSWLATHLHSLAAKYDHIIIFHKSELDQIKGPPHVGHGYIPKIRSYSWSGQKYTLF
jgi:hypothetical protein